MSTVAQVRRFLSILALAAGLSPVTPALAHNCATPSLLKVGQPAAVNIGVTAEELAVTGLAVTIPDAFTVSSADPAPGWTVERSVAKVVFEGGRVAPFACGYFTVRGTVTRRGTFSLPLALRFEDGTTRVLDGTELNAASSGQLVFAGTDPAAAAGSGTPPRRRALMVGLVVLGGGLGIVLLRRRRAVAAGA